jgi:uncharacterized protein YheU (UPF0270 family)
MEGQDEGGKLGGFFRKNGEDAGGELSLSVSFSEIKGKLFHGNVFILFHLREVLA